MSREAYRLDVLRASNFFGEKREDRVAMVGVFPLRGTGPELYDIARWTVNQSTSSHSPRWKITNGIMALEHYFDQSDIRCNLGDQALEVARFFEELGPYRMETREMEKVVCWYNLTSDPPLSALGGLCIVRKIAMEQLQGLDRRPKNRVGNFGVVKREPYSTNSRLSWQDDPEN